MIHQFLVAKKKVKLEQNLMEKENNNNTITLSLLVELFRENFFL